MVVNDFFFKLTFRVRKRYNARRMSVISDQTIKSETVKRRVSINTTVQEYDEYRRQLKRDSRHTIPDDETATDWIPEIPFWNVSLSVHAHLGVFIESKQL